MRLKQRRSVDLPQPDGPMNAVILVLRDVQVDIADGAEVAVVGAEAAHLEDVDSSAPRESA